MRCPLCDNCAFKEAVLLEMRLGPPHLSCICIETLWTAFKRSCCLKWPKSPSWWAIRLNDDLLSARAILKSYALSCNTDNLCRYLDTLWRDNAAEIHHENDLKTVTFEAFNDKFGAYVLLVWICDDVTSRPGVQTGDVDADWDEDMAGHGGTEWVWADNVPGWRGAVAGSWCDVMVTGAVTKAWCQQWDPGTARWHGSIARWHVWTRADVVVGGGIWFPPALLFCTGGIGGGASEHARRATRGRGTTEKPPIPRTLTSGRSRCENNRPPLDLEGRPSDDWQDFAMRRAT